MLVHHHRNAIITWLCLCAFLLAVMVLVGGYTRLSGSGLSITQWKPIHGVVPPLGESQWQEEFDAYRASPQYRKINKGMSLGEFKTIFWPEYWHRVLGRLIGLAFALPLLYFAARRALNKPLAWRLAGIFALGGLQGFMGWYMVRSGLVSDPYVSHIRLAMHLSLAFAIIGLMVWTILDVVVSRKSLVMSKIKLTTNDLRLTTYLFWFTLLCLQIALGALVAGSHAGLIYNTWPAMNGQWLPADLPGGGPWWHNLVLLQFMHRKLAVAVAAGFIIWWYFCRAYVKHAHLGKVCFGVASIIVIQFALGVLTLVHVVPLPLALAHQATGLGLFTMAVLLLHALKYGK
jgi:cytochrome c oxidase assembly protein subunit 15